MQHYRSLQELSLERSRITIGAFDGLHLGHQRILKEMTAGAHADGSPAVLVTFHPHPDVVLRGARQSFYLTTPDEKAELAGRQGVDIVITHPFDKEVASLKAADFLNRLNSRLNIEQLWVGHDFVMGANREAGAAALSKLGAEMGFSLNVVSAVVLDGEVVSSSRIRELLLNGEVGRAAKLLGRAYQLSGLVEAGAARGKTIGFPTANLKIDSERVLPALGVYVCRSSMGASSWKAVVNVGVRPTFEDGAAAPRVEAHLLEFDREIYGEDLHLEFLSRLRGEQRFNSVDELVAQIHADIGRAREYFAQLQHA
jgi:riboflavin kinase/FMN adenylyltransferase